MQQDIVEFTEGDSRYLAPEVMQGVVSTKADVFSLGVSILEVACHVDVPKGGDLWHQLRSGGEFPDPSDKSKYILLQHVACMRNIWTFYVTILIIYYCGIWYITNSHRSAAMPRSLYNVVKMMLIPDPLLRPEIKDIMRLREVRRATLKRNLRFWMAYLEEHFFYGFLNKIWKYCVFFVTSYVFFIKRPPPPIRIVDRSTTPEPLPNREREIPPTIVLNDNSFSDGKVHILTFYLLFFIYARIAIICLFHR